MDIQKILYTPLDIPPPPAYDQNDLIAWLDETDTKHNDWLYENDLVHGEKKLYGDSAVRLIPAYQAHDFDPAVSGSGWVNNFDKRFPELSCYLYQAYNIPIEELGALNFILLGKAHQGKSILHFDPDSVGMRIHLYVQDPEVDRLYLFKTKELYEFKMEKVEHIAQPLTENTFQEYYQPTPHRCHMLGHTQGFFLNNWNSAHVTYNEIAGHTRLTVGVFSKTTNRELVHNLTKDLIVRSAEKYKDHAILW